MPFKKFDEYMNEKGKVVEKPKITPVADYNGPKSKAPEKSGNWVIKNGKTSKIPGVGQGKPGDYHPTDKPWKQKDVPGNGLVEKGLKAEKYPKNTMPKEAPAKQIFKKPKDAYPAGSKSPWKMKDNKNKTEQFIEKTSKMNLSEFTKYMLSECACEDMSDNGEIPSVTAYAAGKFHPHPPEAIKYIVHLAKANPNVLSSLIHELSRAEILPDAMEEGMEHPEGVDGIVDLLGDEEKGPRHARAIARSMGDQFHKFMDAQDDLYESVAPPYSGFSSDDEHEDSDEPDDSESSPSLNDKPEHDSDRGNEDEGSDKSGPPEEDDHEMPPEEEEKPKHKKLKKKFAHNHMIEAMGGHEHMRDAMADHVHGMK